MAALSLQEAHEMSQEEIINWMLGNMASEDIRKCLDPTILVEEPETSGDKPKKMTKEDLIDRCNNKPYIIDSLTEVGGKQYVSFWWWGRAKRDAPLRWIYYSDKDEFLLDDFLNKECSVENVWEKAKLFTAAIELQRKIKPLELYPNLTKIINFAPVLIYDVGSQKGRRGSSEENVELSVLKYYFLTATIIDKELTFKFNAGSSRVNFESNVPDDTIAQCGDAAGKCEANIEFPNDEFKHDMCCRLELLNEVFKDAGVEEPDDKEIASIISSIKSAWQSFKDGEDLDKQQDADLRQLHIDTINFLYKNLTDQEYCIWKI